MSSKEIASDLLTTISKNLDLNLDHLIGSPIEKKLIRQIEEYGDLQWRLAHAHREMFGVKNINDAL